LDSFSSGSSIMIDGISSGPNKAVALSGRLLPAKFGGPGRILLPRVVLGIFAPYLTTPAAARGAKDPGCSPRTLSPKLNIFFLHDGGA
jgi:hypothetical protein